LFLLNPSQNILTKKLKIGSVASSGVQGRLTHFMQFPWPPLEAEVSIATFGFLYKRGRKLLFLIHTLLKVR
jgi:hypothetical protein